MSLRSIILLALAALIAFAAANLLRNRLTSENPEQTAEQKDIAHILVATTNIPQGSFVREGKDFEWAEWPKHMLTDNFLSKETIKAEDYNGAVAVRAILKGEPLSASILVTSDDGGFMPAVLQPGMRAISIAVDATTGNAGFIFPGDRVDLIVTHSTEVAGDGVVRSKKVLASKTFVEDVRILAVDQKIDNPENKAILAKTVTLEVSRKQAEKVNVAKEMGKISLSLRALASNDEPNIPSSSYTRDSDVSPMLRGAPPKAPVLSNNRRVQVFRGNEKQEVEF